MNKTKFFNEIVNRLASDDKEAQLSAAILIRRFMATNKFNGKQLREDAINVVSSILRVVPTGIYQKTLADGLAFAGDLTKMDLQRTNLQDFYLGEKYSKNAADRRIVLNKTDFYRADLSFALIENVDGREAIMYDAILLSANIKNSDFSRADFRGADLTNIKFVDTILDGANFKNAKGVPEEIACSLNNKGIFIGSEVVTNERKTGAKKVFFSMPGSITKVEQTIINEYKQIIESEGYKVDYYTRDHYPMFGQLNKVRKSIQSSDGVVAFGFKQIGVNDGKYYPDTPEEKDFSNEYLPSPWIDIEVGMALMLGIPVLLVSDPKIGRGVFDAKLNECFVGRIGSDSDLRTLRHNDDLRSWISRL